MSKEEIKRLIMLGVEIATDNCVPTSPDEFGIINIDFDDAAIEDEVNNAVEYGYKAAQQSKGQYSLEDMKKAIKMARLMTDNGVEDAFDTESISGLTELCTYGLRDKYSEEEIIQSLCF